MRFVIASALPALIPCLVAAQPAADPNPSRSDAAADAALQAQLEQALAPNAAAATSAPSKSGALTISNAFNPAMSVNGLFLGTYSSEDPPPEGAVGTGMGIQEVEMQFVTNVDPYFAANIVLAIPEGEGLEVEEGYLQPFWQPGGLSFRIGKLKLPFGRENYQHSHALPFIDKSLVGSAVFGEEGLNEFGVEASWLVPTPWYLLFYASALDGRNELLFASERGSDFLYFGGLKSVFDLTDDATLELGGSYAGGKNADAKLSQVVGAHAIVKWKPARDATTRSLVITAEWLYALRDNAQLEPPAEPLPDVTKLGGIYGYVQWQLARRWFVSGRYDYLGLPLQAGQGITRRGSALLVYAPSEFSAIRLQGSQVYPPFGGDPIQEGFIQFNFTLGAHPAHAY